MRRGLVFVIATALVVALPACDRSGHTHGDDGDSHASHGPAPFAVTHWTDRTELFMEYPPIVAGEKGRAAIHLTDLRDFSPVSAGEAVVVLRGEDGGALEFRGEATSPGIFGVDIEVANGGAYEMSLRVEAPGLEDVHELGPVTAYVLMAPTVDAPDDEAAVSFLKEQQWKLEFGTTTAGVRGIRSGATVPATVQPRAGGDALLTSPVPGRIDADVRVPVSGSRVRAGEVVARIAPRSDDLRDAAGLRAALVEVEQSHVLAQRDRDRAERLVEARAIPARRLDEAEAALTAATARLDAARERWNRFESLSQSATGGGATAKFAVRAPFDGIVSEVRFTAGGTVEEGERLMRIVDPAGVHVVGTIPESQIAVLGHVLGGEIALPTGATVDLGAPLAADPVIDPITRTSAVRFALDNRDVGLRIGQAVRLRVFVGKEESGTAIPESAVVDDAGQPVVFVQSGGETFERRVVRLGSRGDGHVQVLDGIEPGERVVHRGAYLLRLASTSTEAPAHGHVH